MQKFLVSKKKSAEMTEKEAIKFLKTKGYSVEKEILCDDSTVTITNVQIIDLFYDGLKKLIGAERTALIKQDAKDLKALQRYQEKAKRFHISKKNANIYLYEAIKLFFKYKLDKEISEELRDITPHNVGFLLGAGSWILDKVIEIHHNKLKNYQYSAANLEFLNKIYEEEDETFLKLQAERHFKILNS